MVLLWSGGKGEEREVLFDIALQRKEIELKP